MKRFQVIRGQFFYELCGESDTLRGAKAIATKHTDSRLDGAGWRKPSIYFASDCKTLPDGHIYPVADPVSVWDEELKTWEDFSPVFGEL